LKRLCTKGVEPYWVKDRCAVLLELDGVTRRLGPNPSDDDAANALVDYLRDAVGRIDWQQHRIVLEIVLALDTDYLGETAIARRTAAGLKFRGGRATVTWGTVRQYHEKNALDKLCVIIMADEEEAHGSRNTD
jgi:hypothetical protein